VKVFVVAPAAAAPAAVPGSAFVGVFAGAIARGAGTGTREIGAFIAGVTLAGFGGIARAGRVEADFVLAGAVLPRPAAVDDFADDFTDDFAEEALLPLAARFFEDDDVAAGFLCAFGAMYPCGTFFAVLRWVADAPKVISSSKKNASSVSANANVPAALRNAMAPSKKNFEGEAPKRVREVFLFILEKSRSSNSIE
jgi:hypothetical protein